MLEIDGLEKRYGTVVALDGASFTARPGRLVGFLGPNGAGKTTTSPLTKPAISTIAIGAHSAPGTRPVATSDA